MVPTRDGGTRFRACLEALAAQRPALDALVVIDSGSTDGSVEAAQAAGARVERIAPEAFDHGDTRNAGAEALPDDLDTIVFLVQDAVPRGEGCLAALAEATHAPGVAAATARQVAPEGAGFLTASTVSSSPFASEEPRRTGPLDADARARLSPVDWRGLLMLDNVACAVRGELFREVGFRRTMHGEDALLAYDLLCGGWAIAHEPRAVVEHGHEYDPESVAPRYRDDAVFFRETFGLRVRPDLLSILKGYHAELRRDRRWLAEHPDVAPADGLRSARKLRWAQVLAQREGSRGAVGGLPEPRAVPAPTESAA
ncbi:MAG: glycosyltransferase family 2 protein [Planctomycetota bacterium]